MWENWFRINYNHLRGAEYSRRLQMFIAILIKLSYIFAADAADDRDQDNDCHLADSSESDLWNKH